MNRLLNDDDLKRIKILKMKLALKGVVPKTDSDQEEDDLKKTKDQLVEIDDGAEADDESGEAEDSEGDYGCEAPDSEEGEAEVDEEGAEDEIEVMDDEVIEEDLEKSASINTSDLESQPDENPHGFVWAHNLDTYRRNKRERL